MLNSRIRDRGLLAWEILFQPDSDTLKQLDLRDTDLAEAQVRRRVHDQGASHRSGNHPSAKAADIHPGSLVYIKEDGDKTRGRERYLVIKVIGNQCTLMKLNKSKLQKKEYHLKVTEVYPVLPNIDILDTAARRFDDLSDEEVKPVANLGASRSSQLMETSHVPTILCAASELVDEIADDVGPFSSDEVVEDPPPVPMDTHVTSPKRAGDDALEAVTTSPEGITTLPSLGILTRPARHRSQPIKFRDYVKHRFWYRMQTTSRYTMNKFSIGLTFGLDASSFWLWCWRRRRRGRR